MFQPKNTILCYLGNSWWKQRKCDDSASSGFVNVITRIKYCLLKLTRTWRKQRCIRYNNILQLFQVPLNAQWTGIRIIDFTLLWRHSVQPLTTLTLKRQYSFSFYVTLKSQLGQLVSIGNFISAMKGVQQTNSEKPTVNTSQSYQSPSGHASRPSLDGIDLEDPT